MDQQQTFQRLSLGMAAGYVFFMFFSIGGTAMLNTCISNADLVAVLSMLLNIGSILLVTWLVVRSVPTEGTLAEEPFDSRTFWFCFFTASIIAYLLGMVGSEVTNIFLSFMGKGDSSLLQSAANSKTPIGSFFSIVFVAPIFEELIFRKVLFERLRPYGNGLAVIVTSILFGLYHGNFEQIPYTLVLGIFLGAIMAITGDIRKTILFHFINNLLSGISILTNAFCPSSISGGIGHLLNVAAPVVGIILMAIYVVRHHGTVELPEFLRNTDGAAVKAFFMTKGAVVFIILVALLAITMLGITLIAPAGLMGN